LHNRRVGQGAGRTEASQRSRWFDFTDDIVVRVAPANSRSGVDHPGNVGYDHLS
jgi:hypothetical protein